MKSKQSTRVRLADVAARAGVSVATVSMALQNHPGITPVTRRSVRDAARALGYRRRPSAPLVLDECEAPARRIGFLSLDVSDKVMCDGNFEPLIDLLMRQAPRVGVQIQMATVGLDTQPEQAQAQVERFARGLDGLMATGVIDRPQARMLARTGVPLVILGGTRIEPHMAESGLFHRVSFDILSMARAATRHLLLRGRRRVALMNGVIDGNAGLWSGQWLSGYLLAHAELGVKADPVLQIHYRPGEGRHGWLRRLGHGRARPDAVVWSDVNMFASAQQELAALGLGIDPADQALGGQKHRALIFKGHPLVMEDGARLARAGIEALEAMAQRPGLAGSTLYLPFESRGLDLPDEPSEPTGDAAGDPAGARSSSRCQP